MCRRPVAGLIRCGQRVDVGGLQFGELAIFEDHARDYVILRQRFEDVDGGGDGFAFAIFDGLGEVELVEENVAEFFG